MYWNCTFDDDDFRKIMRLHILIQTVGKRKVPKKTSDPASGTQIGICWLDCTIAKCRVILKFAIPACGHYPYDSKYKIWLQYDQWKSLK